MATKKLKDDLAYTLSHAEGPARDYSVLLAMLKTFKPHFEKAGLIVVVTEKQTRRSERGERIEL